MTLRTSLPTDRHRILEITAATFGPVSIDRNIDVAIGPLPSTTWVERKCHAVATECDCPENILVAVDSRGVVQGYASVRWDPSTRVGGIPNLAVDPQYQGSGLGRRLLESAIELLTARGAEAIRIETLEQNPIGKHLYPSLGFVEVARQIHYVVRVAPPTRDATGPVAGNASPPV
ncbi:MAG: GNAT family N-acetyltransferase [Armatimonadota bacterium]